MSRKERDHLRAEIGTLKSLLAALPEGEVIERLGFERRLDEAHARLAELDEMMLAKPLLITFRGAPVEGMRSIEAGFASSALRAFIDATDTVDARHGAWGAAGWK
jgi:hypothetical protein